MNSLNKFLNKNGKVFLSVLLAAIMLFSLSACKNEESDLVFGSPIDDSSNTSSMVFIDDDRQEDDQTVSGGSQGGTQQGGLQGGTQQGGTQQGGTNNNGTVGTGSAKPVSLSSIPAYSGKPYVVINNNAPNFSKSELTTKGYEKYSNLDKLGRCGVALASVGKDTMPTSDRGSLSYEPTGWIQASYDCVPGRYLYNRSHLIGWQLSAENDNEKNLITGTKFLNNYGMLPFENMIADYIKETGNHVAYRVTPIYSGNNLLANGVQMEAYSVEDNGKGICFNVYCYNVQDGVTINYKDGSSYETNPSSDKPVITDSTPCYTTRTGTKYHSTKDCSGLKNASAIFNSTVGEATANGLSKCAKCY